MNPFTKSAGLIILVMSAAFSVGIVACDGKGDETPETPSTEGGATPTVTVEVVPTPETTLTAVATPDLATQRIAYIDTDLDIWLMSDDGSGNQKLLDLQPTLGDFTSGMHWSPDGSKLAVTHYHAPGSTTYIVTAEGDILLEMDVSFLAWAPSGDTFAAAEAAPDAEPALLMLDTEGNNIVDPLDGIQANDASFSADGRHVAFNELVGYGGLCGELRGTLVDLQTAEVTPIDSEEEPIECGKGGPIFSPVDPSLLAYGERVIDLATGKESALPGYAVAWSPDGQLLEACADGHVFVHDINSAATVIEFDIPPAPDGPCWMFLKSWSAWSPDSRLLGSFDHNSHLRQVDPEATDVLHIRDIATGDDSSISMGSEGATRLQFSADGRRIVLSIPRVSPDSSPEVTLVHSDGSDYTHLAEGQKATWQPAP